LLRVGGARVGTLPNQVRRDEHLHAARAGTLPNRVSHATLLELPCMRVLSTAPSLPHRSRTRRSSSCTCSRVGLGFASRTRRRRARCGMVL
jgi:hypothetical protein